MKLRIDWLVVAALVNVLAALVCAVAVGMVARESWAVATPVVGWFATAALVYFAVLRERGLS